MIQVWTPRTPIYALPGYEALCLSHCSVVDRYEECVDR